MKRPVLIACLTISSMFVGSGTAFAEKHYETPSQHAKKKTVKRVGVGTAGGAVVGALAGGGKGAAVGAAAGAGGGYLYDKHKKKKGQ